MTEPAEPPADPPDAHLSQLATSWTVLFQAHGEDSDLAGAAQRRLLQRYSGAAYRYLMAAVRDREAADELFQELALRFLRGDFRNVRRERGRFRDFLKRVLSNLVTDHFRQQQRRHVSWQPGMPEPEVDNAPLAEADASFLASWRKELIDRTWDALTDFEKRTGQTVYTVLRFRVDHPEMHSPEMASALSARLGKTLTPEATRKRLFAAREKFAELLLEEVRHSLGGMPNEELAQELSDLGLMEYCRAALQRLPSP